MYSGIKGYFRLYMYIFFRHLFDLTRILVFLFYIIVVMKQVDHEIRGNGKEMYTEEIIQGKNDTMEEVKVENIKVDNTMQELKLNNVKTTGKLEDMKQIRVQEIEQIKIGDIQKEVKMDDNLKDAAQDKIQDIKEIQTEDIKMEDEIQDLNLENINSEDKLQDEVQDKIEEIEEIKKEFIKAEGEIDKTLQSKIQDIEDMATGDFKLEDIELDDRNIEIEDKLQDKTDEKLQDIKEIKLGDIKMEIEMKDELQDNIQDRKIKDGNIKVEGEMEDITSDSIKIEDKLNNLNTGKLQDITTIEDSGKETIKMESTNLKNTRKYFEDNIEVNKETESMEMEDISTMKVDIEVKVGIRLSDRKNRDVIIKDKTVDLVGDLKKVDTEIEDHVEDINTRTTYDDVTDAKDVKLELDIIPDSLHQSTIDEIKLRDIKDQVNMEDNKNENIKSYDRKNLNIITCVEANKIINNKKDENLGSKMEDNNAVITKEVDISQSVNRGNDNKIQDNNENSNICYKVNDNEKLIEASDKSEDITAADGLNNICIQVSESDSNNKMQYNSADVLEEDNYSNIMTCIDAKEDENRDNREKSSTTWTEGNKVEDNRVVHKAMNNDGVESNMQDNSNSGTILENERNFGKLVEDNNFEDEIIEGDEVLNGNAEVCVANEVGLKGNKKDEDGLKSINNGDICIKENREENNQLKVSESDENKVNDNPQEENTMFCGVAAATLPKHKQEFDLFNSEETKKLDQLKYQNKRTKKDDAQNLQLEVKRNANQGNKYLQQLKMEEHKLLEAGLERKYVEEIHDVNKFNEITNKNISEQLNSHNGFQVTHNLKINASKADFNLSDYITYKHENYMIYCKKYHKEIDYQNYSKQFYKYKMPEEFYAVTRKHGNVIDFEAYFKMIELRNRTKQEQLLENSEQRPKTCNALKNVKRTHQQNKNPLCPRNESENQHEFKIISHETLENHKFDRKKQENNLNQGVLSSKLKNIYKDNTIKCYLKEKGQHSETGHKMEFLNSSISEKEKCNKHRKYSRFRKHQREDLEIYFIANNMYLNLTLLEREVSVEIDRHDINMKTIQEMMSQYNFINRANIPTMNILADILKLNTLTGKSGSIPKMKIILKELNQNLKFEIEELFKSNNIASNNANKSKLTYELGNKVKPRNKSKKYFTLDEQIINMKYELSKDIIHFANSITSLISTTRDKILLKRNIEALLSRPEKWISMNKNLDKLKSNQQQSLVQNVDLNSHLRPVMQKGNLQVLNTTNTFDVIKTHGSENLEEDELLLKSKTQNINKPEETYENEKLKRHKSINIQTEQCNNQKHKDTQIYILNDEFILNVILECDEINIKLGRHKTNLKVIREILSKNSTMEMLQFLQDVLIFKIHDLNLTKSFSNNISFSRSPQRLNKDLEKLQKQENYFQGSQAKINRKLPIKGTRNKLPGEIKKLLEFLTTYSNLKNQNKEKRKYVKQEIGAILKYTKSLLDLPSNEFLQFFKTVK